jgi:nucleotide-binding universal stress UspA family protein
MIKRLTWPALLLLPAALLSCAEPQPRPTPKAVIRPCPVRLLALAPFLTPFTSPDQGQALCPISAEAYPYAEVGPQAAEALTNLLPAAVERAFTCALVTPDRVAGALPIQPSRPGEPVRQALAQAARKVGAEVVVAGTIFRFRERVGTAAGIQTPASVYLALYALEAKEGKIIWSGVFEETQRSLAENLFNVGDFLQRGGRWLTAAELGQSGLAKLLARMRLTPED